MKVLIYIAISILSVALFMGCSSNTTDGNQAVASNSIPLSSVEDISRSVSQSVLSNNPSGQRGIWVNGSGLVNADPDMAILNLGVETIDDSLEESRNLAARKTNRILDFLDEKSVDSKDIRTHSFNIYPRYEYHNGKQSLKGYTVSNKLSVTIRDLSEIGPIIDGVSEAGGNATRIDNIRFALADTDKAVSDAREKAIEDAISKADQFAASTGISRGDIVYISEYTAPSYASRDMNLRSMSVALEDSSETPINSGQLDIRIEIQAVFSIEPK